MSNFKMQLHSGPRSLLQSALATIFAVAAFAPATGMAQIIDNSANWYNPQDIVWKNSTGLCWRSSSWTPANATAECDPELMPRAAAPAPIILLAAAPPPPPPSVAPAPAPAPRMQTKKVNFSAEELFDFDKAVLKPDGKAALDTLASDIHGVQYETILVTGHTDRIGRSQYNQKLSERRADVVNTYLITKGIPDSRTTSKGMGETQPATKLDECQGPVSKKLIACLQPDRRVEVEVAGSKTVTASQ